jgi:competence CoiA-like predicted nuclease
MKSAVLRPGDKREITAQEAALKNEKRAFCPDCGEEVNLHVKKSPRGVTHFEHKSGARKGKPCPRHYH